ELPSRIGAASSTQPARPGAVGVGPARNSSPASVVSAQGLPRSTWPISAGSVAATTRPSPSMARRSRYGTPPCWREWRKRVTPPAVSDPDVTPPVLGRPGTHVRPLACDRRAELLHRVVGDFCQLPPDRLLEGAPRTRERDEGDQGPGYDDQQDRESLQLGP